MDWRSVKFDWNRARAFLITAEEGSLTAAAKALGLAQPTLGRQVEALERELGVVLFERVGRSLSLTPSGLELLDHVRQMGEAATKLSLSASGHSDELSGNICITASEIYCVTMLPQFVAKLRKLHPGVKVEIIPSNDALDLQRREADIAIRSFRPTEGELYTKYIGERKARFYATPDYLNQFGEAKTFEDLLGADFIGFTTQTEIVKGLNELGYPVKDENFPVLGGNHFVHWELTKYGVGIGVVPEDIGDSEPRVRRALPDDIYFPSPIWLTTHRELKTSRRVRTVFDLLAEDIAKNGVHVDK